MPKIRKIYRSPETGRNYFLADACFLVNKYIPPSLAPNNHERHRIERCLEWWEEIDLQLESHKARIYIPDICIAETFKTLSKKYFDEHWFSTSVELAKAKRQLCKDIVTLPKTLREFHREIKFHDIPTS